MKTLAVFLFLFLGLNTVQAQNTFQPEQFGLGGDLQLNPVDPPKPITSITWKYQGNIVAEWIKDKVDLEFLGILKNRRPTLDLTSGQLTIPGMKKTDEGNYTVEINNRVQGVGFTATEVKPVPKPEVIVRPLTCNELAEKCKLSCEAKPGLGDQIDQSEPVKYFWKEGDGEWKRSEKDKSITNDETRGIQTFSCKMGNKISEMESLPLKNPFHRKPESGLSAGSVAGIIIGVFLLVCVALGAVGFKKWEQVKPYLPCFSENSHLPVSTSSEMGNKGENNTPVTNNVSTDPRDQD